RDSLSRQRDNAVRSLDDAKGDVDVLAARAYWRLRGLEALRPWRSKETVAAIGLGDVERFWAQVAYPENAVLSVVSDRPAAEVRPLLEAHFGGWRAAGKPALDVGAASVATGKASSARVA